MMLADWQLRFPNCEPVAHQLRVVFAARWVRFHSLPESKRYPEDESEYATVLGRHNGVLSELVGPERRVILLTTGYSDGPDVVPPSPNQRALDPGARLWRSVPMPDFDGYWHIFASEWEWHPGLFDRIVRLVADDAVREVMVVDPDCLWVLHPYDGGMDVILETPEARDQLRSRHRDWLSAHPDGL
jgi:hypothetical protein